MKFSNLTNVRHNNNSMFADVDVTYGFWIFKKTRTETVQRDSSGQRDNWIDVLTGVKFESGELDGLIRAREARHRLDYAINEARSERLYNQQITGMTS